MTGELFINNKDAWDTWGINLGEGFLDVIDAFPPMKEYVTNESRLEHGRRVITDNAKVGSQDINLPFTIMGSSPEDYQAKKNAFQTELQKGGITMKIPSHNNNIYHLVYKGKSSNYALSSSRDFSKFVLKFEEPNPMNRE